MSSLPGVTLHRLRDGFVSAIAQRDEILIDKPDQTYVGAIDKTGHRLTLFTPPTKIRPPIWKAFLQPAFEREIEVRDSASTSAVLLIEPSDRRTPTFVLTFGQGRHLLKPNSIEPRFGLKVALNAICAPEEGGGAWNAERVRSVDAKRVGDNSMLMRHQAARKAAFEIFDIDIQRDLVRSVTGEPVSGDWGSRITGADSLRLSCPVTLDELGEVCGDVESLYGEDFYKQHFDWIDYVQHVTDDATIKRLEMLVVRAIRERAVVPAAVPAIPPAVAPTDLVTTLDLAPPDVLDWDTISGFRFSIDPDHPPRELALDEYIRALRTTNKLGDLSPGMLAKNYVIATIDDEPVRRWSIERCLVGSIFLDGQTYVLDEGRYYAIDANFESGLDAFVDGLDLRPTALPPRKLVPTNKSGFEAEKAYNVRVSEAVGGVCMDMKNVSVSSRTTSVEVCDILLGRELIHVKPLTGSATLSHLFAQGTVSAELLVTSPEFRHAAAAKVATVTTKAAYLSDAARRDAPMVFGGPLRAPDFTITYAMLGKWKDPRLSRTLPFFSKINLRAHVQDLKRMDFAVRIARVETESVGPRRRPRGENGMSDA